jgi:beta-alanine--pyruvate transaminase
MDLPVTPATNDLGAFWMPFTNNRWYKQHPRQLVSAVDMHYRSGTGHEVLDGTAGLWCVNAGHARPKIVEAVQRQVAVLDYAPTFQLGHPAAFELASRLKQIAPGDLNHVFFTNSGSESVDTALKIALAYHRARGEGQRTRLIGRERGYHGTGFGGITVGGIVNNRKAFSGALLPGADHLPHTHSLEHNRFSKGQPAWGAHLADELERLVTLHDASTIAAVIVEPVAGSTGVLIPPVGYLERLRAITERHGILLIFDEVITGYGRLGTPFAADYFGVLPDMMATAKGLTNGVVPMGAVFARDHVHDAIVGTAGPGIELFHGYTYSGHPIAAAAGIATLDTYRDEALFERAAALAPVWEAALHSLRDARHVIDIRTLGLIAGIELEPRAGAPTARAMAAFHQAFDEGCLIRVTGDIIALSPPLIVSERDIDQIVTTIRRVLAGID